MGYGGEIMNTRPATAWGISFFLTALLLAVGACHDGSPGSSLRVAAVQVESRNGDIAGNLARAEDPVRRAAAAGARLVLLPEFLPTGYIFEDSIWEAAEPPEGETVQWLNSLSSELGIYLGTTFLEAFSVLVEGTCSLSYTLNPDRLESSLAVTPEPCDLR